MSNAYINKVEKYMPNDAVTNDQMESRLGLINGNESKSRNLILRNNGIKTRYYALDDKGKITHTNAKLASLAVLKLLKNKLKVEDIDLLTSGTSSPDAIQPSHSLMVHGELGGKHNLETMSAQGTCNAGMLSLKYAYLALKSGESKNAVNVASETFSSWMLAQNFQSEIDKRKEVEDNPYIAFEKDFLRWMLSDGAVAALVQDKPNDNGISLKIEWIDVKSFANELDTCMYAGCVKNEDGSTTGWRELNNGDQILSSVFSLKQDAKLLQNNIIEKGNNHFNELLEKRNLDVDSITYFLPHLSSMFFKKKIIENLKEYNIDIPEEKWFINLTKIGNVGAASGMLMVEELFNSGRLKIGDKILMMIPESARFSYTYVLLTAV
ncbi:MAG: beta-ketoacyl-ACP synthase III [Lentimicrobiaceae bacterium]|jgi:3-oxoacyl-[acyl-carrier-protein] synthase-3|nr:beta-ketoacyl-ACP synthase III [Lentimicrobiaceae bacterium]MCP4910523.1 beta-ketoacyl-ACP synthase III [Bacteroidota bacterium]MBT3455377.1 beta-ketoacyl-ACP synthase III [Lentimicrobiaceae bacterium]MBT3818783.1 beta-ketoacyl-ACP synthase III [Lentimicrobiaceae bacterium]MBT4062050.1 beta-ketoacyl-ACP synthase III [Lentimicrobiaceae bacterium]